MVLEEPKSNTQLIVMDNKITLNNYFENNMLLT